ncbi:GNAT family N-acetyltransferase [Pseudonocardia parietis]|uniref:RimJ/RimL family protein N-acetyltransferase n=1 Tax=Pseudonocardia parietis TaxID=570936 RepID=A0ABS4W4N2_9PSEU|nr:GNAT family N-acetyltransferase [Pseudonocardia parietis]MBP2371110.1 RimJ/RimL family protein N-acetyltransferase [Pseudonocardia parietis]
MDVRIRPLDERGLADLLEAAVAGTAPAEVMPCPPGATWDDELRTGFLAFHRARALAADPVERTWVIRVDGCAAGALRLEPVGGASEIGIWLARGARGRGAGTAAVRLVLDDESVIAPGTPLVARTTAANTAALGLLGALGAAITPGTEGAVTAQVRTDDHGGRSLPVGHRTGPVC